jgi:hypothetical protein
MNSQDILSIVSITISTVLSVGAIILSFVFYKESNKQNKETSIIQTEIKNAITQLEKLLDRTYTDTFGALKNNMEFMQKHIINQSIGKTNISETNNNIRFSVLEVITEKQTITIDELCSKLTEFKKYEIQETVIQFHKERIVEFSGKVIKYLKGFTTSNTIGGQSN